MTRPRVLVVVLGTGTEVGKTFVSVAVAEHLRAAGVAVAARKPAQSFAPGEEGGTDADLLAAATGVEPHEVCPPHRWYETPMAPPMAADALGRPQVTLADLAAEITWPDAVTDVGLVETAGGPASPIAHDGDGLDLTARLQPDRVALVADAGLGTINAVRLVLAEAARRGLPTPVVHLNRYDEGDDLHRRNRAWLAGDGIDLTTTPGDLADRLRP